MKNSRLYAALLLSVLLALLLIFHKEFEGFLGRYFLSKFPEGSRTPLSQLFTEHMEMVVISSALLYPQESSWASFSPRK